MNRLVLGLALLGFAVTAPAAEIQWEKSYDQAVAKAKSSGKLLMIDFYTDW